jgi:hypothetical protein
MITKVQFVSFLILGQIVFNSHIHAMENLPSKLKKVLALKEEGKEVDPILRYEAIMDTYQTGLSYKNTGDSARALKLLKLGLGSFPFDSRIKKAFDDTLLDYMTKLNRYITSGKMDCGVIEERVQFLSKVSPDSLENLEKGSCKEFILHENKLGKDILDRKFLDISIPKEISGANIKEVKSGQVGLLDRINKSEALTSLSNKEYKLEFPKHHILANGLKYLGVFSLKADTQKMQFIKNKEGSYMLAGSATFKRAYDEMTYEGLCRNIKPFFQLKHIGSVVLDGTVPCGVTKNYPMSPFKGILMTGNKEISPLNISVMKGGMRYLKGAKAPFSGFLPRFLVMDVYYHRHSGTTKAELVYEVKDPSGFLMWFELLDFVPEYLGKPFVSDRSGKVFGGKPPVQVRGNKTVLISNLRGATLALNVSKEEAKGLKEVELVFNRKKTYELTTSLW